jgi:hypothetical protein
VAKDCVESVTKEVSSITVNGNMQFIDNPGFNDASFDSDAVLWIRLMKWLRNEENNVFQGGYTGFINIV